MGGVTPISEGEAVPEGTAGLHVAEVCVGGSGGVLIVLAGVVVLAFDHRLDGDRPAKAAIADFHDQRVVAHRLQPA